MHGAGGFLELLRNRSHRIKRSAPYCFRDSNGQDVDVILDRGVTVQPMEIKAGAPLPITPDPAGDMLTGQLQPVPDLYWWY
jgi:hypothetical protein